MMNSSPVVYVASAAMYSTKSAISSGVATRPIACRASNALRNPGVVARSFRQDSVFTVPGQTQLIRKPSWT